MKYFTRITFCLGLFALTAGTAPTYAAVNVGGFGAIDFEGTGTITHMQLPPLFEVYGNPCTEHFGTDFTRTCKQPLDMSLLGNDIVRAEHFRIELFNNPFLSSLRFGCPNCGTPVSVGIPDLVFQPGGASLSTQKTLQVQTLIDQFGASSVRMSLSFSGGFISIFSSVRAVGLDIKPGGENSFNPRSRGVIGISILTTQSFNASSVDVTSLRFGVTGQEASPHHAVLEDVDGDGDTDLLVFFRSQDTDIDCDTLFTYLSGETLTGQAIAGTDSIAVVGCH
jgi:hypothetical protein